MKKMLISLIVSGFISPQILANTILLPQQPANPVVFKMRETNLDTFNKKWFFKTNAEFRSAVFGQDETIYFTTTRSLHSINAITGNLKWSYSGNYHIVDLDSKENVLYIIDRSSIDYELLLAINSDGKIKWKFDIRAGLEVEYPRESSVRLSDDKKTIYISSSKRLLALDVNGQAKWSYPHDVNIVDEIDGNVYSVDTAYEHVIKAFDAKGKVKWSLPLDKNLTLDTPAVVKNNMIYFIPTIDKQDSRLYAISVNGEQKWTYDFKNHSKVEIVSISDDGFYILASGLNSPPQLLLLSFDKEVKWSVDQFNQTGEVNSIFVEPNGTVYLSTGHEIYVINKLGKIEWTYHSSYFIWLAGISNGSLYAYGEAIIKFNAKTGDPEISYPTRDLAIWMRFTDNYIYTSNYFGLTALAPT